MAKKPTRDQFPKGLLGNRRYQLALEAYNRGIQPPAPTKPKPKPVDRRTNLPGGRTNKPAPAKEMPENLKVKPNREFLNPKTGERGKRFIPNFYGPGGSSKGTGQGQAQQNPLSPEQRAKIKPKPAEVQPAKPTVRASEQKPTVQKPAVKQSSNMDKNYEAWAKANRKLAEKVKPGQAGYDAIQKALGKSSSTNGDLKIKPENKPANKTNTAAQRTQEATDATKTKSTVKPQEFNTRNVFETPEQRKRRLAREKLAK
jgi:hypothetical protein